MDAEDLLESVESDNETALSRLNSSKALFAATGGEMDADRVLRAAADDAAAARATFAAWADDEPHGAAADAFDGAAETAADQLATVRGELDGYDPEESDPVTDYLRDLEGTAARAGGLLGWAVVAERTLDQVVGFFVGDADPTTASTFRGVRDEIEAVREAALDLLADLEDRAAAAEAAHGAVEAAYDDYVETLEGMGVNPKNVC